MRLNIPLLPDPQKTLERWAPEIRSNEFFLATEFVWKDYLPIYGTSSTVAGAFLITAITTYEARYAKINNTCFFSVAATFTLSAGGANRKDIRFSLPFQSEPIVTTTYGSEVFTAATRDGAQEQSGHAFLIAPSNPTINISASDLALLTGPFVGVRIFNNSDWAAGNPRYFWCSGFYKTLT